MRLILLALVLTGAGCKKKAAPAEPAPEVPTMTEAAPAPKVTQDQAVSQIARNFSRVHFALDSTELNAESIAALQANAKILQDFTEIRVEVQGHADERGTTDYNLALGERRANAIRDRLQRMGVGAGRVTIVSYGEEKPLAAGSGESAWSQNRRAEFRVLRGAPNAKVDGTTP